MLTRPKYGENENENNYVFMKHHVYFTLDNVTCFAVF